MKQFLFTAAVLVIMFSSVSYAEEIEIIANRAYPANTLSIHILREIYFGEKAIEGNIRIKPFDQRNREIRKKFLTKVLGVSEDGYNAYWIKKVFQEGGAPPVMKSSSDEVIRAVKEEDGGIGYIWKHEGNASGIKVLLTVEVGD
jgi:hypothetical protein